MRVATLVTAIGLLASGGLAAFDAVTKPGLHENVTAGSTYSVEWKVDETAPTGPVTIALAGGPTPPTLDFIGKPLATGYDNSLGKFTWTVDSTLGEHAVYGIHIALESNSSVFQWSDPFYILGEKSSGSSSSAPSSTSTSGSSSTVPSSSATESATTSSPNSSTTASGTETPSSTVSSPKTSSATTSSSVAAITPNAAGRSDPGVVGALGVVGLAALLL